MEEIQTLIKRSLKEPRYTGYLDIQDTRDTGDLDIGFFEDVRNGMRTRVEWPNLLANIVRYSILPARGDQDQGRDGVNRPYA